MYQTFVILTVLAAVLLTLLVLVQESKGGGLASNFAGSNNFMGVRKTTDFVEKATWTLAALLVIFSVASHFAGVPGETSATEVITTSQPAQQTPTLPGQQTAQPAAPAQQAPANK